MKSLYFRLAQSGATVSKHWAYDEAWMLDGRARWIDNRQPGFQVWPNLGAVIVTLQGVDRDGIYSAAEYPSLLLIEASDASDSAGIWLALEDSDIDEARAIPSSKAVRIVTKRLVSEYGREEVDDADWNELERWIDDDDEIASDLWNAAKTVKLRYVETLPKPASLLG